MSARPALSRGEPPCGSAAALDQPRPPSDEPGRFVRVDALVAHGARIVGAMGD